MRRRARERGAEKMLMSENKDEDNLYHLGYINPRGYKGQAQREDRPLCSKAIALARRYLEHSIATLESERPGSSRERDKTTTQSKVPRAE